MTEADNDNDNVVILEGPTSLAIPPARVLNAALNAKVEPVVVIGFQPNGALYFASNTPSDVVLILLELAKKRFIDIEYQGRLELEDSE